MNETPELLDWRLQYGFTHLHAAAYSGDLETVTQRLAKGDDPNILDAHGNTALYWACFKSMCTDGSLAVINALIVGGAAVSLRAHECDPPLVAACQAGHAEAVSELINAGANANDHVEHRPPIVAAAQRGAAECVSILLAAGADPDSIGEFRLTAREWAESYGFDAVLLALNTSPGAA